jgi:malate permease and related proteins
MNIINVLLPTLLPLYLLIPLGYLGGRYFGISKESIAYLVIYFIAPIVIFTGILTTEITWGTLSIPIIIFLVCTIVSFTMYFLGGKIWHDATKNVFAFGAGSSNTGFFGVPVAIALFGKDILGLVALTVVGTALFSNSVGFFIAAKGKHTTKEALQKLFRLPILYALLLGIICNVARVPFGSWYFTIADHFTGAYVILGMMLIGMSLAERKKLALDYRYHALSFFAKFIFWPSLMLLLLKLDAGTLHLYTPRIQNVLILISFMPIAVNTAMYATILKTYPEKIAMDVLISTIAALLIIPLAVAYFF